MATDKDDADTVHMRSMPNKPPKQPSSGRSRKSDLRPRGSHKPAAESRGRGTEHKGTAQQTTSKAARPSLPELLRLYRPDIADFLATGESPTYRYTQVYQHLLQKPLLRFSEATALPLSQRGALDALGTSVLEVVATRTASDGTKKMLLEAQDGARVETVLMIYPDRVTACVSSQVGCPVGCRFCATGTMGFKRNLTVAEIVDQVRIAAQEAVSNGRRLSRLVFMGMGEPLLNLKRVSDAILVLTDPHGLGLGRRSISVSTVGIPRAMVHLAELQPQVNLALSLHATEDRTRALLIPQRFCYPLESVLEAAWQHFALTRRKLLVEYVMLHGLNDTLDDARRLAGFLRGRVVAVNLIPWNPALPAAPHSTQTRPAAPTPFFSPTPQAQKTTKSCADAAGPALSPPPAARVAEFRSILVRAGIEAVIRESKGRGIGAGCGQLAAQHSSYH